MPTRKYYKGEITVDDHGILHPKTTTDCVYDDENGTTLKESLSNLASKDDLKKKADTDTVLSITSINIESSDLYNSDLRVYSHDPSALIGLRNGTRQITSEASFTFDAATQAITSYIGTDKDVIVPAKINGVTVKSVTSAAFKNKGLYRLTLPNTIIEVGTMNNGGLSGNFFECIYLPPLIKTIGRGMFSKMKSLTKVVLSACVTNISQTAFSNCSLQEVTFPDTLEMLGGDAFDSNRIKKIILPNSVTAIKGSFINCGVEVLKLSNKITGLDYGASAIYGWSGNKLKLVIWEYPSSNAEETVPLSLSYAAEYGTGAIAIRTTKTEFVYNLIANSAAMSEEQKAQFTVTDMQGKIYVPPAAEG